MSNKNQKLEKTSKVSEAQIQEWKDQGKKPVEVLIPLEDDDLNFEGEVVAIYITRPDRNVSNSVANYYQKGMLNRINQVMVKNCVLGGDIEYITEGNEKYDDDIFDTVMDEISKLTEKRRTRVKKR